MLLLVIGRGSRIDSDADQRRLLRVDFECLRLLFRIVHCIVSWLSVVSALRHRIGFGHVIVILTAMLMSTECRWWLGDQILLHRWVLRHPRLESLEFDLVSRDHQRAPIGRSLLPTGW